MEFIRVEDCCEILDSQRKPITESERVPGRYPYYGANGIQGTINQYIFDDKLVLVAEDGGHFGSKTKPIAYLVNGKCWVNNHAHVLRAKKGFLAEYICYSLMFYKIEGYINGATRQKLTQAALRKLIIPKRPVKYQKAIVDRLDLVKCIIEKKQDLINELDVLIKSRFDELFLNTHSIEIMKIGELFEVGSSKRILQSELTTYGIPFYRVTDLINRINDKPIDIKQYVDELKYMTLVKEKYVPQAGDLLITARGTIGKIYEVKQNDKFYFQDGMITWLKRKNNYINNSFFVELVKTDWFRRQFYSSNNGTTISYLSITDTRHLKVLLPALNLQLQFAQEVYQINKLKSDVQKSIDETQLLMDSLMQEYFG